MSGEDRPGNGSVDIKAAFAEPGGNTRLAAGILASVVVGGLMHFCGRYGYLTGKLTLTTAEILTDLAIVILLGVTFTAFRRVYTTRWVIGSFAVGGELILFVQTFKIFLSLPPLSESPFFQGALYQGLQEGAFACGVGLFMASFYFGLLEASRVRLALQREREELLRQVAERQRMSEALRQANAVVEERIEERTATLVRANKMLEEEVRHRQYAEAELTKRADLERLIASIATRFIQTDPDLLDTQIGKALESIAEFLDVDRGYIDLLFEIGTVVQKAYEWYASGLEAKALRVEGLSLAPFEWMFREFAEKGELVVPRVRDLPDEASTERTIWESLGIQSLIAVPLKAEGELLGVLGLSMERRERTWTKEDVQLLWLVGEIYVNVLLRARVRRALLESERRYRNLVEGLSEAVYRVSVVAAELQYMSPAAIEVFGYPAEAFLKKRRYIWDILHPEDVKQFEAKWQDALHARETPAFEYRILDPDGEERWILQSQTVVRDDAGHPVAIEGICRNITEERRARQSLDEMRVRLAESSKLSLLGEMASNVAHEINNPLAVVSGCTQQLQRLITSGDLTQELADDLSEKTIRNASRIHSIVKGLQVFTRGGEHDPFVEASFKSIVEDTIVLCRDRFLSMGAVLSIDDIPGDIVLECRPTQIMEVLFNLLSNALHAVQNKPERWVTVGWGVEGERVLLTVTDSGDGIPPEMEKTVFEPFVTTKAGHGTGLGLSISRNIAQSHHGTLYLDRTSKHTCFVLQLPRRQSQRREVLTAEPVASEADPEAESSCDRVPIS